MGELIRAAAAEGDARQAVLVVVRPILADEPRAAEGVPVAQGVERPVLAAVGRGDRVLGAAERAAVEARQTVEAVVAGPVVVELAVGGREHVLLVQAVAVAIVAVFVAIDIAPGGTGGVGPTLVDHAAEAIEAGVRVGAGGRVLGVVDQIDARLAMAPADERVEAEVVDRFEANVGAALILGQAAEPADAGVDAVDAAVVDVVEHAAARVGHRRQTTVVGRTELTE